MSQLARLLSRFVPFIAGLLSVAVTTVILLAVRPWFSPAVVDLLFLLPVVLTATWGGLQSALAASVAAFLALNYFFLSPKRTLLIEDPNELVALLVFLFITVVTSRLVSIAHEHAAQAHARELESTTLYDLSRTLSAQSGLDEALCAVTRRVTEVFGLAGCEILLSAPDGSLQSGAQYWAPDGKLAAQDGVALTGALPEQPIDILLTANQAPVGVLRLSTGRIGAGIGPSTVRMLTTVAAQLGLTIERARLAREAARVRLLEEADQFKSTLLSSVSHDLRTPLAAIKAATTVLMQQDIEMDAAVHDDLLVTIDEEADRLNRLVGDLLDMSRIEGGALDLRRDWCDLDELIRAVVRCLSPRMASRSVQMDWPADLPLVYADYAQVDRVVTNLLENAIRFAPSGSTIEIAVLEGEAGVTLSVANEGPAIPAEVHPYLFTKFYRISEERASGTGTGLGLSICKGIVEAHGGQIWVESPVKEDRGARFVFTLPYPRGMQSLKLPYEARTAGEKAQDPDR